MAFTLAEIAGWIDGEVIGDSTLMIEGVRSLESAGPADLAFLAHPRYKQKLEASRAGAVLLGSEISGVQLQQLIATDPRRALVTILGQFTQGQSPAPGVHATAALAEDAEIDPTASIGPLCTVGAGARIGPRVELVGQVAVGAGVDIGEDSVLYPFVCIYDQCRIGKRVRLHAGVVIGADGFGYASDADGHHKLPHLGITVIEDDVEIGANSTIDRAMLDETVIGAGTKIDNLVQVGHNARLGRGDIIVAGSMIAGSARLGDRVVMGGHAGVAGHLTVADDTQIASNTSLHQDSEPGSRWGGVPAIPLMEWKRLSVRLRRLADMERRLNDLEQRLADADDGNADAQREDTDE